MMKYVLIKPCKLKMASSLTFKVTRKPPELISPARPTPYEFKYLSDIDNDLHFRYYYPVIHFYEKNPSIEGKDPVNVIRDAISKALVFYYPFAGRLRESAGGKLVVECTGEGVAFVEADADVTLHQFGRPLYPPFPCVDELLPQPCTPGITNSPLFLFQVTRLKCGGFILAYYFIHALCDAAGLLQFMSAIADVVRGGAAPSIPPVWQRHLLRSRRPPHLQDIDIISNTSGGTGTPAGAPSLERMVHRSFFLSAADIFALRRSMPPHLQSCSKFDLVAACAWYCRTVAISPKPDENVIFIFTVDIRNRITPPLPVGYYGNGIVLSGAVTTAAELLENPLHHAVDLVREAKNTTTDEYVRSYVDAEVIISRASLMEGSVYVVSDLTSARLGLELDIGWGKAVYGGVAKGVGDWTEEPVNWYIPLKDDKGEEGIIIPVYLPFNAMEAFAKQLQLMITTASNFRISAL